MNSRSRRTARLLGVTTLVAASSLGLAGCGAYISTNTGVLDTRTTTEAGSITYDPSGVSCGGDIINDPYTAVCQDYVDADGNSVCDLSGLSESDTSQVSDSVADADDSPQTGSDGCPLAPCVVCGICANMG